MENAKVPPFLPEKGLSGFPIFAEKTVVFQGGRNEFSPFYHLRPFSGPRPLFLLIGTRIVAEIFLGIRFRHRTCTALANLVRFRDVSNLFSIVSSFQILHIRRSEVGSP